MYIKGSTSSEGDEWSEGISSWGRRISNLKNLVHQLSSFSACNLNSHAFSLFDLLVNSFWRRRRLFLCFHVAAPHQLCFQADHQFLHPHISQFITYLQWLLYIYPVKMHIYISDHKNNIHHMLWLTYNDITKR